MIRPPRRREGRTCLAHAAAVARHPITMGRTNSTATISTRAISTGLTPVGHQNARRPFPGPTPPPAGRQVDQGGRRPEWPHPAVTATQQDRFGVTVPACIDTEATGLAWTAQPTQHRRPEQQQAPNQTTRTAGTWTSTATRSETTRPGAGSSSWPTGPDRRAGGSTTARSPSWSRCTSGCRPSSATPAPPYADPR